MALCSASFVRFGAIARGYPVQGMSARKLSIVSRSTLRGSWGASVAGVAGAAGAAGAAGGCGTALALAEGEGDGEGSDLQAPLQNPPSASTSQPQEAARLGHAVSRGRRSIRLSEGTDTSKAPRAGSEPANWPAH